MIKKVGVFDSGIGGLSVLKKVVQLPIPHIVYFADTAHLPYGLKTPEQIQVLTAHAIQFFVEQGVDAIVIACHTASAIALELVQRMYPSLPVIGVVDAVVDGALKLTKNNCIGVMGTPATIASDIHRKKILERAPHAQVIPQACPQLVPLIEDGLTRLPALHAALQEYLAPLQSCDTIIVGCTHYEFIKHEITTMHDGNPTEPGRQQEPIGRQKNMQLASAPERTAAALEKLLDTRQANYHLKHQAIEFFVTGDPEQFRRNSLMIAQWEIQNITPLKPAQIHFPVHQVASILHQEPR